MIFIMTTLHSDHDHSPIWSYGQKLFIMTRSVKCVRHKSMAHLGHMVKGAYHDQVGQMYILQFGQQLMTQFDHMV